MIFTGVMRKEKGGKREKKKMEERQKGEGEERWRVGGEDTGGYRRERREDRG